MSVPLWYQVYHKQLSFKEFLDRFNDRQFQEREVLPIFVLSVLYEHDPYIKGSHILNYLMYDNSVTERSIKYFYLYWAIGKGFSDDLRLAGCPFEGTFRSVNITLNIGFTSDYLNDWIGIILRAFFGISIFLPENVERTDLTKALKYSKKIQDGRFVFPEKTTEKMYKLSIAHDNMIELIQVFKSGPYPNVLKPYRKNLDTFKNIVLLFAPSILFNEIPFSHAEWDIINVEHKRLYESGDIDFFLYYIEEFIKVFGRDHKLSIQLQKYIEPSYEIDRLRTEILLIKLNPIERQKYIPQKFGVTDSQLNKFFDHIKREGIVSALSPYILNNKKIVDVQLNGCELANDVITSTQYSIYLYPLEKLIFYTEEDDKVYVFLPEELLRFDKKENPYNRKPLPGHLYINLCEDEKTENLEEMWTKILRHTVSFETF
jgi:hypothetical protein